MSARPTRWAVTRSARALLLAMTDAERRSLLEHPRALKPWEAALGRLTACYDQRGEWYADSPHDLCTRLRAHAHELLDAMGDGEVTGNRAVSPKVDDGHGSLPIVGPREVAQCSGSSQFPPFGK